jgi:hypothetical protein
MAASLPLNSYSNSYTDCIRHGNTSNYSNTNRNGERNTGGYRNRHYNASRNGHSKSNCDRHRDSGGYSSSVADSDRHADAEFAFGEYFHPHASRSRRQRAHRRFHHPG